ncbi:hypothetical protein V2J09_005358 [Rumex salicifolius]
MGIYLSSPKTEKASEDGGNGKLRYGLSSMQGWRTSMEDAVSTTGYSFTTFHAAIPNLDSSTSFFAVYDGHGGKCVSKFCAKYLHQEFLQHEAYQAGDLCKAIQKAFLRMDEVMCGQRAQIELREMEDKEKKVSGMVEELLSSPRKGELAIEANGVSHEEGFHCDSEGPTAGSTACVAIVATTTKLIVANAGDSRCVISRRGQAHDLSKDHKPDLEEEKERILKAGGFIQSGRINGSLNLARAIGDMEFKKRKDLPPEKQMVTANPDVKIGLHVKPRSGGLRTRAVKIRKDAFCDMSESSRQVFGAFIGRRRMRQHDNDPSSTQQQNLKILVNSVEGLKTSYYMSCTK